MKKIFLQLIVSFVLLHNINAQTGNVGIGTATPDASAILEISATNKGLLIPRLNLSSSAPSSPAPYLLVFNTNNAYTSGVLGVNGTGIGYYYNAGTAASPVWYKLPSSLDVATMITTTGANRFLTMTGTTNQVNITPTGAQSLAADRTWTFSLPQNIHTGATPTFAGETLSGLNTNGGVVWTNASGTLGTTAAGTTGQILQSNGAAAPTWVNKTTILNSQNGLSTVSTGGSATATTPYVELGGTLYKGTVIDQGGNTLAFNTNSTAVNAFSVDGTTLSVDAANDRVGISNAAPAYKLDVNGTINAADFGAAGGQNIRVGDDAFLSDMDLTHTMALISSSNATLGTLQLGNNSAGYVHGNSGNIGLKTTTLVQDVNVGGRLHVSSGVIQSGGTAITGTADLGLYSRTSGSWIRIVTNAAPINFFSDDNTGTSLNVSITAAGKLEAQKGFYTKRQIYFYKRTRSNGGGGVDIIGNYDFCFLAGVAFRNSDSATDEDDDYQCNVYTLDINASAEYNEGENETFTGNFNYNTRPSWRLYSECYQDCSNSTCTVNCINFDF